MARIDRILRQSSLEAVDRNEQIKTLHEVYYRGLMLLNIDLLKYHILPLFTLEDNYSGDALKVLKKPRDFLDRAACHASKRTTCFIKVLQRKALEGGRLKFLRVCLYSARLPRINVRGNHTRVLRCFKNTHFICYIDNIINIV